MANVPFKLRERADSLEPPRSTSVLPRTGEVLIRQGNYERPIESKVEKLRLQSQDDPKYRPKSVLICGEDVYLLIFFFFGLHLSLAAKIQVSGLKLT